MYQSQERDLKYVYSETALCTVALMGFPCIDPLWELPCPYFSVVSWLFLRESLILDFVAFKMLTARMEVV